MNEKYQKLYDYALRLLSFRARTRKEIERKLHTFSQKRKIEGDISKQVIADLIDQKLLDDHAFVTWWIDQRNTFRPKGKKALEIELLQKGIEKEVVREVLATSFRSTQTEYELARNLIQKKFPATHYKQKEVRQKKITGFLARRGFSYDTIRSVIDSRSEKE